MSKREFLQTFIQESQDAFYILDLHSRNYMFINPTFEKMFGYTPEELSSGGFDFLQIIAEEDRERLDKYRARILDGLKVPPKYEFTGLTKSGTKFPAETHVKRIKVGKQDYSIGIIRDISDKRELEMKLTRERRELEVIIDSIADAICIIDPGYNIVQANNAAFDRLGRDIIGRKCYEVHSKRDDPCEDCPAPLAIQTSSNVKIEHICIRYDKNRKRYSAEIEIAPVFDKDNRPNGYIEVSRDVTDRLSADEESEYLTNVSHQIISPLSSIVGYLRNLIAGTYPQSKHPAIYRYLMAQVKMCTRLTRNLSYIKLILHSDLEAIATEMQTVELLPVLIAVATDFQGIAKEKSIRITVREQDFERLRLRVVHDLFFQAVMNILDNAVKYSDENTVISVQAMRGRNNLHIEISNQGIKLRSPDVLKVFERKYRAPEAIAVVPSGTGIGLWLAQRILQLHGGKIVAKPTDSSGRNTFSLILPNSLVLEDRNVEQNDDAEDSNR